MSDHRCSDSDVSKRDIPSFIEPRPPLIKNAEMRPRPQKGTNLLELFEDSESEGPEWVQVYLRLKPCNEQNNLYEVKSDRCLITSVDTATAGHGRRTQHHISKMYTFSHIFGPESSQKDLFEHVVKDNLRKLPDGHNFTLLTYGASGSGKTYTLMGTVASPGLVPRSLEYVFRVVDAAQQPLYKPSDGGAEKLTITEQEQELQWVKQLRHLSAPARDKYRRMSTQLRGDLASSTLDLAARTKHYVWVSFVEIYNEAIYDLLSNSDRSKSTSKLRIREDANGNVYVKGATQAFVRSGEAAYDVLVAGKLGLQVAATGVHARSSRSHCIFTITMLTHTEGSVRVSSVRLCDLAGCERARHTRNAGARMRESRAINASLHVLERCLHTLRRRQRAPDATGIAPAPATLVPYRESKLTRLLGAGLCGGRGGRAGGGGGAEAVAMVVTLNPAAQFALESRHVLQLAAVARDIQVNNTIAECESTLESFASSDCTVLAGGGRGGGELAAELLRLRADNERLHFELLQAHSRIGEQRAAMEARQQQTAREMFAMVDEAKDMTSQYYDAQLQALRDNMEEMQEEYEAKLRAAAGGGGGTPSRALQKKVAQLMTEIAILEENLTAERLARARAETEVQHLRACVDERDEKAQGYASANDDEMDESDSDSEEDERAKDSLEPTFKKEDINRSRILRRSLIAENADASHTKTMDIDSQDNETIELDSDTDDSILDKTRDAVKNDDSLYGTKDSTYITEESETSDNLGETYVDTNNGTQPHEISKMESKDRDNLLRGTYGIRNSDSSNMSVENAKTEPPLRGTYFVSDAKVCHSSNNVSEDTFQEPIIECDEEPDKISSDSKKILNIINTDIVTKKSNISAKSNHDSDISLAQFERFEKETKNIQSSVNTTAGFTDIQNLKEKTQFFEDNLKTVVKIKNEKKTYFESTDVGSSNAVTEIMSNLNLITDRSPSIVKDDVTKDFEPNKIKKLLGQSFTKQPDIIVSSQKAIVLPKKHVSVDIFDGFDSPNVIFKAEGKRDAETASLLTERPDMCKNISQEVNCIATVRTEEVLNKVTNIDVGFEKLHKDIVKIEQNVETTGLVKNALEICVDCKQTTDNDIIEKPQNVEANNEIYHIKTGEKLIKNIALEEECDTKKQTEVKQYVTLQEPLKSDDTQAIEQMNHSENNTIDEFENIYKDLTAPRATEFELLVSQEVSSNNINESNTESVAVDIGKPKYNLRHTSNTIDKKHVENVTKVVESEAKVEIKQPKRNLRLRRRKNQGEDDTCDQDKQSTKLKDIVNLQKEFSDVTLDVPAARKDVNDIASPEKLVGEENLPPLQGFQSCPSKSVTRSRRKLFTPRAEPLDESASALAGAGDSLERVLVPRPSYHRGRARRKL